MAGSEGAMAGGRLPVLFDTDIGSDIDDALALAYLLGQPRCELLGITTVSGDTAKRGALCDILCRAAGVAAPPIHAGARDVILHGPGQPNVPQYEAVAGREHRLDYPADGAVPFLRETIRSRPGEITLLAVGPMTNLATLFLLDPEIPALLREIVLMCGVFTGRAGLPPGAREWNALVDPLATAIVFARAGEKLTAVGLDVTRQCRLPADECRQRFAAGGGALGVVAEMAEVWFRERSEITFHDPLAAALLFAPDLCRYETGRVEVVSEQGPLAGLTRWEPGAGPHRIATEVDPDRFFAHYLDVAR